MLHTPKTIADKIFLYLVIFRTFALANKKNQFTITTNETRLFFLFRGFLLFAAIRFTFLLSVKGAKENALKAKYFSEIRIGRMNRPGCSLCSLHPLFYTL